MELLPEDTEQLIVSHIPLAQKLVSKYCSRHRIEQDVEDIRSAALLALCRAANRFRPDHGATFATFAHFYITGAIKLSAQKARKHSRVAESCAGDLVEAFGHNVHVGYNQRTETVSIDLSYAHQRNAEDLVYAKQVRAAVRRLPARLRRMIALRYYADVTLIEAAAGLAVSRCHASRLLRSTVNNIGRDLGLLEGEPELIRESQTNKHRRGAVQEIVMEFAPAEFTLTDLGIALATQGHDVAEPSIRAAVMSMVRKGRIEVIDPGMGVRNRAAVYRRAV